MMNIEDAQRLLQNRFNIFLFTPVFAEPPHKCWHCRKPMQRFINKYKQITDYYVCLSCGAMDKRGIVRRFLKKLDFLKSK